MIPLLLIGIAIAAYFLGGINGAIILSKYVFKKDVRNYGSGNAGLTNFYRTFGTPWTVAVVLIDVAKSILAVLAGGWILGTQGYPVIGQVFAGFCLILGHIYPILYQFRGGKGVLCAGTMLFVIDWRVAAICWGVFFLVLIFTQYVSLGSICAAAAAPLCMWAFHHGALAGTLTMFCAIALILKHYSNIFRLINHEEPKLWGGRTKIPKMED